MATPVKGKDEIAQVAAISAADPEIGDLIAEVMEKVGKDGVITVEESKGLEFETEYTEGMQIDRGYISPYFVTNTERMEAELDDPVHPDHRQEDLRDRRTSCRCWRRSLQHGKPLVIIAEDVDGEALATLVVNKLRGTLNVLAVKAPGFGDRRKEMLRDIAVLTGGQVISEEIGRKLDSVDRRGPRPRPPRGLDQGRHHLHRGRMATQTRSRAASSRSAPRSRPRPPTSTARSCRSGWPSWPAAWR